MDGLGSLQMVDSLQEAETLHFESEIGPFGLLRQPVWYINVHVYNNSYNMYEFCE